MKRSRSLQRSPGRIANHPPTPVGSFLRCSALAAAALWAVPGWAQPTFNVQGLAFSAQACAKEYQTCTINASRQVAYGAAGVYRVKTVPAGTFNCGNGVFGDPIRGKIKSCHLGLVVLENPVATGPLPAPSPTTTPATPASAPAAGTRLGDLDAPTFSMADPAIRSLLEVWNKPDAVGMSCVQCHGSPNAAEFALVGISVADVMRRGLPHHDKAQIEKIVAGVDKLKQMYKIGQRDREKVFLMQPGPRDPASGTGTPLPGKFYWERDAEFVLKEMPRITPTLATRIETLDQAKKAIDELVATEDTTKFRVPFVSPFYSGDPFRDIDRGESTKSLNKWVAIFPMQPKSPQWAAEIEAKRNAYMQQPSNYNFYQWFKAEKSGASAFGANMVNTGRSAPPATINLKGFGQGSAEGSNSTFQLDYWTAEFEKNKRLAAMVAFHQMLQESLGMSNNLLAKGHYAFELFDKTGPFNQWISFNPFHSLGDDSGRPSAVRTDRLIYPSGLLERLGPDFRNHTIKAGQRGLDAVATENAALDAVNWWAMSQTYDGGRRAPTMDIEYWALHMQSEYGLTRDALRLNTPRANTIPGYNGYSAWAFLRGQFMDYAKWEKYKTDPYEFAGQILSEIDGIENSYGIANPAHHTALIRLALNSVKLRLASPELARQRALANGKVLSKTNLQLRGQYQIAHARRLAERLPAAEAAAEIAALDHFFAIWMSAIEKIYAGSSTAPSRVPGKGNGLEATYFDDPNFTMPLLTETVPRIWYGTLVVNEQSMTLDGTLFNGASGTHIKGLTGTDHTTAGNPVPSGNVSGYSVEWRGFIEAPTTGDYDVYLDFGNGLSGEVYVNNVMTFRTNPGEMRKAGIGAHAGEIKAYGRESPAASAGSRVRMEAGRKYPILVKTSGATGNNFHAHLHWQAPKVRPAQPVPTQYLYTSLGAQDTSQANDSVLDLPFQAMPNALAGVPYSVAIATKGGNAPLRMRMGEGTLPPGLTFNNGVISGVPTQSFNARQGDLNKFSFSVIAFDADGDMSARRYFIYIGNPALSNQTAAMR